MKLVSDSLHQFHRFLRLYFFIVRTVIFVIHMIGMKKIFNHRGFREENKRTERTVTENFQRTNCAKLGDGKQTTRKAF
jgi:hypothetical protein